MALIEKLSAIGDAIREKTGGTELLTLDEMPTVITSIETGGGGESDVIRVIASNMGIDSNYKNFTETVKMLFECNCKLTFTPDYKTIGKQIKLIGTFTDSGDCYIQSFNMNNNQGAIQEIDLAGRVIKFYPIQTFRNCVFLKKINAKLLHDGGSKWDRTFLNCGELEEIAFVENSISLSGMPLGNSSKLTDNSLISIANGLMENTSGAAMTLTMHATPKSRCDEINGTVSTVTEGDLTHSIFAKDESGATTLTEFITSVKGWTLA